MKRFEGHTASLQLIPRAPGSHCKFLNKRVIWPEVEGWPGGRQGQIEKGLVRRRELSGYDFADENNQVGE